MVVFVNNKLAGPKYWASSVKGKKGLLLVPGQNEIDDKLYNEFLKTNPDFKDRVNKGEISLILPPIEDAKEKIIDAKKKIKEAAAKAAEAKNKEDEEKAELEKQQAELDDKKAQQDLKEAEENSKDNNDACESLKKFNTKKSKKIVEETFDIRLLEKWLKDESRDSVVSAINKQIIKVTPDGAKEDKQS